MTTEEVYQDFGFSNLGGHRRGSLTADSFVVDEVTYTVKLIEASGWFYIGLDKEVPFTFSLEVDGVVLRSGDADRWSYSSAKVLWWSDQDVYWGDGDRVKLALYTSGEGSESTAATGSPTITGTVQVGQTLTAVTSGISDEDGLTNVSYTYQWIRNDGDTDTDITSATSSTYTVVDADEGKYIKVKVSFTDDGGNDEELTSDASDAVAARPNRPATGAPTVSGTVTVGQTLTAVTSGISDADGLTNVSYAYQWIRNDGTTDTDINSATSSTYTLVEPDQGKYIKLKVSFTDDADNNEELTSDATAAVAARPNRPATGAPTISGSAKVGQTLTADTSGISDADGLTHASYSYQWIANNGSSDTEITGATASTFFVLAAYEDQTIKLRVSFTDDAGHSESLTSAATDAVALSTQAQQANTAATGAPTVSGTAQVGQTLTADTSGISDADSLTNVSYAYQWIRNDGTTDTDITGATSSTYTLVDADQGKHIKVKVSFTDDAGHSETLTSAVTGRVAARPNRPATGAPTITGTAKVGQTLTVDSSGISDADGLTSVSYTYQWIANDGTTDTGIQNATGSTYTILAAYEGDTIKVKVSFTDDAGHSESLTSEATDVVSLATQEQQSNNAPTGTPTISGTAQVGQTLTVDTSGIADVDGLTEVSYTYQWIANDGTTDTDISGATSSSYALVESDEGKYIKVKVSFTDDTDNDEELTSEATAAVMPPPPGYITVAVMEDTSVPDNIVTNLNVSWNDTRSCSAEYNAYLNVEPSSQSGSETLGTQQHLGSAAKESDQVSKSLTGIMGGYLGFTVEVFCGTDESGRMVSQVSIPYSYGRQPKPGTYSSEPSLSALAVSHGTLTPSFNSYTFEYKVPDVANGDTRTTITATPKEGYSVEFFEASDLWVSGFMVVPYGPNGPAAGQDEDCKPAWQDSLGLLYKLTDADPDSPGFQVDLYDGTNYLMVNIRPILYCDFGEKYEIAISRADGDVTLTRPNRPVGGDVRILGGPWRGPLVGTTLSANVSDVWDRDGWDVASFSYQWLADDVAITGANASSYTVTEEELGKALTVRVSFTDGRGAEETLTSSATTIVRWSRRTPIGTPVVGGNVEVGQTLTAETSAIADDDGQTNVSFEYQWIRNDGATDTDIFDATSKTYALVDADKGKYIKVKVSFTDDANNVVTLTSAATDAVRARPNRPATGAPTISGSAKVGQTLTAVTSGISDADGLTNVSYEYQWIRNNGTTDSDISNATSSTYDLLAADEGDTIKVKVSFTDDAGHGETLTSEATEAVSLATQQQRSNSTATGAPTISGTAQVGQTLSANTSGISDADGLTSVSYEYQWVRTDSTGDMDISGATGSTYILVDADQGKTIKVKVSFTDDADNDEKLTSAATGTVAARSNRPATGAPTINGSAKVGQTLTADTSGIADDDGLTGVSYEYQWIANDGTSDTEITGATASTFFVLAAYEDQTIKLRVSFTDDVGHLESLTSAATDAVKLSAQAQQSNSAATGAPTISGTTQVGQTLTADTSGISDADGLTNVSYAYQWMRNNGTTDTDITGATSSTYTLVDADQGKFIKVKVTFTDDADNDEQLTSAATGTVAARPNRVATGSPAISGTAQVGQTLSADTSGISDADGLTNASYAYQWIQNDGSTDSNISGATSSTYTLVDADKDKNIKVKVSFTDDEGNSENRTSQPTGTVAPPPLTVRLEKPAASHDGSSAFTFEIRFSEEFKLSFRTLKFHAFDVTGGTILKSKRAETGSNIHWRITVEPQSAGDVSVFLPATTDCTAQGAICTGDGRKLSNRLAFTVSGPS
ncbi:MAG: hypothetical protein OXD50_01750 [Chloroflexi bacterium]|nr:hypothetical protein [Chloroflexota bacterium]